MGKYSVGQVVHLKSGGPKMTIESVYSPESTGIQAVIYGQLTMSNPECEFFYNCCWFKDDKQQYGVFAENILEL